MSQNRKKVKKTGKRKLDRTSKIILIGGAIIVIPFIIFGFILLSASFNTGKPIFGDRFKGDLDPAITSANKSDIINKIKSESGVEKVEVELSSATLRVYVDITDSASAQDAQAMADKAYDDVMSILPASTYFTLQDGKKMYDVEIHVYNLAKDRDSDSFAYVIKNKSSNMETARSQIVSEPLDAELAQQLRDDVENRKNPTPTPSDGDMTVGGVDDTPTDETPDASPEATNKTE